MWYVIQIVIAGYAAYSWTTVPGNSPADLGKGLFLGGLMAWWVTAVISALRDAHRDRIRRKQAKLVTDAGRPIVPRAGKPINAKELPYR